MTERRSLLKIVKRYKSNELKNAIKLQITLIAIACVAWRFWLGVVSNIGRRSRETVRRLGRAASPLSSARADKDWAVKRTRPSEKV